MSQHRRAGRRAWATIGVSPRFSEMGYDGDPVGRFSSGRPATQSLDLRIDPVGDGVFVRV